MKKIDTLGKLSAKQLTSASSEANLTPRDLKIAISQQNVLWNLPKSGPVRFLRDIFGDNLVRSFAIAMDPLVIFRHNLKKIGPVARERKRSDTYVSCGFTAIKTYTSSDRFTPESTSSESFDTELMHASESFLDSTKRLRGKDVPFSEMRSRKSTYSHPSYEELPFNLTSTTSQVGGDEFSSTTHMSGSYPEGSARLIFRGNWANDEAVDSMEDSLRQFVRNNLPRLLEPTLASSRRFNAFYQIGELKDIPQLIRGIHSFAQYVKDVVRDASQLQTLDRTISMAYLNKTFGIDSILGTLKALAKKPEAVSKRFNYLLERNSKLTSQRTKIDFDPTELLELAPSWSYLVPGIGDYEILEETLEFHPSLQIRTVVNTFVDFPKIAVPSLSDQKFRDLWGINPRITDIYNLFPFSWLVDWFTGLGDYLNLIETVLLDRSLVNYGMVTCVYSAQVTVRGKLLVRTSDVTLNAESDVTSMEARDSIIIPYELSSQMQYSTRFNIANVPDVKTAYSDNNTLTSKQTTILAALYFNFASSLSSFSRNALRTLRKLR